MQYFVYQEQKYNSQHSCDMAATKPTAEGLLPAAEIYSWRAHAFQTYKDL